MAFFKLGSNMNHSSILVLASCLLCLLWITAVFAADNMQQGSSSVAFNSGGKGEVMVSCNGKTFKGEGMAACTSSASSNTRIDYMGYVLLVALMCRLGGLARWD